jgi:hypothetical protein
MFGHRRRLRAALGAWNMSLFYSYHDRWPGSVGGFSVGRAVRRLRTTLTTLRRAIAAAKIRRVRHELRLHAETRAKLKLQHLQESDRKGRGDNFPRQPLHRGEKRDV